MKSILLTAIFLIPNLALAQPVAMVLTSEGKATLERKSTKTQQLRAMQMLQAGDKVNTGQKSVRVVFLKDGHQEQLKPGQQFRLDAQGFEPSSEVVRVKKQKVEGMNLSYLRSLAESSKTGLSVLRGDEDKAPQLVQPIQGSNVLTPTPNLSWPALEGAKEYRVKMFKKLKGSRKPLWEATTDQPQLSYPSDESPLSRLSKYEWSVSATMKDGKTNEVAQSHFNVLTAVETRALSKVKPLTKSDDPGDQLLAAKIYEAYGAYNEALNLFERVVKKMPKQVYVLKSLSKYYRRAGQKKLSQKMQQRAKKIEQKQ